MINEYLKKHNKTQSEFAVLLGISQGLVHQWVIGKTRITVERAIQIEEITDKALTRHDLRPDIPW